MYTTPNVDQLLELGWPCNIVDRLVESKPDLQLLCCSKKVDHVTFPIGWLKRRTSAAIVRLARDVVDRLIS